MCGEGIPFAWEGIIPSIVPRHAPYVQVDLFVRAEAPSLPVRKVLLLQTQDRLCVLPVRLDYGSPPLEPQGAHLQPRAHQVIGAMEPV